MEQHEPEREPEQKTVVTPKWPTIFLLIGVFLLGVIVGQLITFYTALDPFGHDEPCPTEDSVGCVWDADTQGNGLGVDVDNRFSH